MASTHLDAFPSFPELPPEIQDLIWDCAAEGPTCPAAHFAAREEIVFEESAMIEPPKPPRKFPTLPSIAVLIRATPPRDLATQPTQLSALLRTSRAARRAALRRRDAWGPARALQLYGADRNTRKAAFQRVHAIPRADTSCGRQPETVVDIPSLWIDADRDLVILNSSWQRVSSFPRRRRIRSWPVQRVRYIAVEFPLNLAHGVQSSQIRAFSRYRPSSSAPATSKRSLSGHQHPSASRQRRCKFGGSISIKLSGSPSPRARFPKSQNDSNVGAGNSSFLVGRKLRSG